MKIAKSMTFEKIIWEKIDEIRGDIPRSRFIARIVETFLGEKNE